jgi:hypothetical protein
MKKWTDLTVKPAVRITISMIILHSVMVKELSSFYNSSPTSTKKIFLHYSLIICPLCKSNCEGKPGLKWSMKIHFSERGYMNSEGSQFARIFSQ